MVTTVDLVNFLLVECFDDSRSAFQSTLEASIELARKGHLHSMLILFSDDNDRIVLIHAVRFQVN